MIRVEEAVRRRCLRIDRIRGGRSGGRVATAVGGVVADGWLMSGGEVRRATAQLRCVKRRIWGGSGGK